MGAVDQARPLSIEPVIAWRTWTIMLRRGAFLLRPIGGDGRPWPPRRPAQARCARSRLHVAPAVGCTCGLHAVQEPDVLRRTRDPAVLGSVALWGRVVEHDRGYRARWAYPQRLRLVCSHCFFEGSASESAPEVAVSRGGETIVPLCHRHVELSHACGIEAEVVTDAITLERELLGGYAVDPLPLPTGAPSSSIA